MDDVFREGCGNNIMNKVCLYYGIICGVFLTSTAAPAADCTVGAIGGGDYAAAYCLKQPGGKYFLPGVAQLQLWAARKKEVDAVLAKLRAATGDGRIYWSADELI